LITTSTAILSDGGPNVSPTCWTTTTAYGLSSQDGYNIDSLHSGEDNIIPNHSPTIPEGGKSKNYNGGTEIILPGISFKLNRD